MSDPRIAHLEEFVRVWGDGYALDDIATSLTCNEFDALVGLLEACGMHPRTVAAVRESHAEGDECGDRHCTCDDPECIKERSE